MHLRRGVLIGRPFGIPLVVHVSWFPAALLLVLHFALSVYAELGAVARVLLAATSAALFFASLIAHELAHALVARRAGVPVVDITLFVFGGVARIGREPARPSQEIRIAAAGPVASAVIGTVLLLLHRPGGGALGHVLWTVGAGNLALATFNLLPGFPLDGGRVLRAWLWSRSGDAHAAARRAGASGQLIGVLLGLCGFGAFVFTPADVEGVWLVVLGGFLYALATASRRAAGVAAALGSESAGRWATPFAGTVAPDDRLVDLTDGLHYAVSRGGRLAGVLTPTGIGRASGAAVARDVMVPWTSALAFPAAQPLTRALEQLVSSDAGVLVVMNEHGAVVGILDHAGVRTRLNAVG